MSSPPVPIAPVRRRRRLTKEQRERQRPLWAVFADADKRLEEEHSLGTAHPMRVCTRLLARSAAAYELRADAVDAEVIESATLPLATAALPGVAL
jgi:hypothetical protein